MTSISEKEIYEIFLKTLSPSQSTSIILNEGKLEYLLLEELEQTDVEKLRQHSRELMQSLDSYVTATKTSMPSVAQWLEANKGAVEAADNLAAKIDLEDPEGMAKISRFFGSKTEPKRALQAILDIESKLATALSSFEKASELFGTTLKDKIDVDTPLKDIPDDKGISPDQLKTGYKKSFKQAKPGMFAKISNFFKGGAMAKIPGAEKIPEFPVDQAAEEVMDLSLTDLKNLLQNTDDVPAPDTAAVEDIAAPDTSEDPKTKAGEDKDGDGKPDTPEEDKGASGKKFPNIDKLAGLGNKVFGKNGDTVVRNFFSNAEVQKMFGESAVHSAGSLANLLFEQEEDLVDFEVFSKKLQDIGVSSEVDIDNKEAANFATAANNILSKKIKVPSEDDDSAEEEAEDEAKGEDNELPKEEKEAADEQAEEVASQIGSGPIKKNALASILKSFPDITGKGNKATRSRRAFRKAINQAAGNEIFQESFDRSPAQARRAAILLLEDYKSRKEGSQLLHRWNKLAGTKED
jgi:hypothetical protein